MVAMQTNPYPAPPTANQTDPTNVMGRRIVAYLIDGALSFVVFVVTSVAVLDSLTVANSQAATDLCDVVNNSPDSNVCVNFGSTVYAGTGSDMSTIGLIFLAFLLIFHVVLPTFTGFSPGKGIMGLRVVKQDTMQTAGFGANLVRWLLWIVDSFPFCAPLVGLITGLASTNHRRVGDMAASTLVVHKDSVGVIPQPPAATTNWAPPPTSMPATPPSPAAPPFTPPTPSAPPPSSAPAFPPPGSTDSVTTPPPPPGNWAPPQAEPTPEPELQFEPVAAPEDSPPEPQPEADTEPTTSGETQPGVGAPQWDEARNTYIQWDPDIEQWMEWNEGQARWVPISQ